MLPSMPLLMTPVKKIVSTNEDSQSTVLRSPLTVPIKEDISVNTAETDQCQINTQISPSAVQHVTHSAYSPPITEVQSISGKKYISPRQFKTTTRQRSVDCGVKKNEVQQKQNQLSLLMPVNQSVTAAGGEVHSSSNMFAGQCVEICEPGQGPDIEKLNVDVGQHAENNPVTSPQQSRKGEGTVKGKNASSISSRRSKKQRELEAKIAALKPETTQVKEERAANYAQTYFMKVKERLEDRIYAEFVQELVNFKDSNSTDGASLYRRAETLLSPHKDLIDEFLVFLTPDQAKQIDRLMDYLLLVKMKDFINKLEVLLTKQCQPVYASLEQLASQPNVSLTDVHNAILPHLKSSPLLTDYFLELLPGERPPDSLMIDYEQADCLEGDEDSCYEMVHVPDYYDPYGGEHCPCKCHETQSFHCINCGIKYINGRVYLQHGKIIRSAKVTFEKEDQEEMLQMKWRGRGEPEIGYTRYHRRRYFPSPVKASDHSVSIKKSPRTPRARNGTASKRNLKSAKGSCSSKSLPLIEGIVPLVSKSEFNDAETEVKHDASEIKHFGDTVLNITDQPKVTVSDEHQCRVQDICDAPQVEAKVAEILCEVVQLDVDSASMNEENVMMNIDEEDTKSPACSQITDVPSMLSPMSFFSESLHSNSGFELINKQSTNSLPGDSVLQSVSQQLVSFSEKLPNLQKTEKNEVDAMDVSEVQIAASNDRSARDTCLQEFGSDSVKRDEEICFPKVKADVDNEILIENLTVSVQDLENKGNVCKLERFSEPMDESTCELQSNINQFSLNNKLEDGITSENSVELNFNPDETRDLNKNIKLQNNVTVKEECELMNVESKNCVTLHTDLTESSSQMSDQKKTKLECSQSSVVAEQKNTTASDLPCWTREEDKIILQAFQLEGVSDQTFIKINQLIPTRTVEEIQKRFQVLLQLLQQLTGVTEDSRK